MRPNHGCTVLRAFVLAGMLLNLQADNENTCEVDVKLNRNTVFKAFLGEDLRINCTVEFCSDSLPVVSWNKKEKNNVDVSSSTHIKTEWKPLGDLVGVSFLIFQKVDINDSGLYQCAVGESLSHYINVSVHGDAERNNSTSSNDTTGRPWPSDPWLYAYFTAGIAAFVAIVVILTVASLRRCKGKSKKETQVENQYVAFVMSEQPFSDCGPLPPPRGSPSAPPCRRSTRRTTPPSHADQPPRPRGGERAKRREDREEEPGGSILYAALQHPPPGAAGAAAAARPWKPRQETSEYAAIRVQETSSARLTL
ncbi:uncharacterized protein LOC119218215 [Pungitius pungitius]|uniref:uncharacterized protein LOC119218215 n=1 Tax=Pungitius pungitius TaxID=134920 RepID=UPI002E1011A2